MSEKVTTKATETKAAEKTSAEVVRRKDNAVKEVKDVGQGLIKSMLEQVQSFAKMGGSELSGEEKDTAIAIISDIDKKVRTEGIPWKSVDIVGCKIPLQIKRFARLGLSTANSEIYIGGRRNGKTGLYDINIKMQYQAVEKIIVRYYQGEGKITNFKRGVICTGDEVVIEEDFETGYDKITKHTKNEKIDRNLLENVVGAYEIAYEKIKDVYVQHVALLDKNRIMRAYNSSASREKTVWKNDTQRMVLKTAGWVLYNNVMRPFIEIPTYLQKDWEEANDQMEFDGLNAENQEQHQVIEQNIGEGELVDFDEETVTYEAEIIKE